MSVEQRPARRYHHGDLRNALADAAFALAREGGPDAVVLREVARRTGVSAAAAYHHFASHEDLVQAVKQRSLDLLAEQMRTAIAPEATGPEPDPAGDPAAQADAARRRVRALGTAYLRFADGEPGLYRLTFGPRGRWPAPGTTGPEPAVTGPFRLLAQALDELAAADADVAGRRAGLEYVVWAAVHGTAVLLLEGPLVTADPALRQQINGQTLDTIIRGLLSTGGGPRRSPPAPRADLRRTPRPSQRSARSRLRAAGRCACRTGDRDVGEWCTDGPS